ncbi:MAG: hypothetical protein ACUVQ3_08720 [bacterium]
MDLILSFFLFQAFERYAVSAHGQALGFACVATVSDFDALRINPSALALVNKNIAGISYEYTFSHIEGLHNIYVGFARQVFYGGLGIGISEFGFGEQKEQALTAAYSTKLTKEFFVAAGTDIYLIQNKRTGTGLAYGLNIGLLGNLSRKWFLGAYGHNLNSPQFSSAEEGILPFLLQAGIGYKPFADISSEIDLSIVDNNIRLHTGGEFAIMDFFHICAGMQTNPNTISFGFAVFYRAIKINYGCSYLADLPLNHIISINAQF